MRQAIFLQFLIGILACLGGFWVNAEDPYQYYTWTVKYGTIAPLGVSQQGILINDQFPGPTIETTTNYNIVVNVFNKLNDSLLITWNGIKQRRTSWQDGVLGTNCPIPPNSNWTYKFQLKDQVGTYTYFASTLMHRASGAFGAFNIAARSIIPIPYPIPDGECTLLVGDWFNAGHKALQKQLDDGQPLSLPDGILIGGSPNWYICSVGPNVKTYRLRISNVGIQTSINFRIQGHNMTLIEVEGAHTLQEEYDTIDVHVGQSVSVLLTLNKSPKDYLMVASSRFTRNTVINATAILRYEGSTSQSTEPLPGCPTYHVHWGIKHARTIRLNTTANAARPNPQGSFHYGNITVARRLNLTISSTTIDNKLRYALNGVSHVDPTTPLKLADWYNIPDVFGFNTIKDTLPNPPTPPVLGAAVFDTRLHDFVEIVFQNPENSMQSMHLDGYSCYVVGYGSFTWTPDMRERYNLEDACPRHTFPVFPRSWTAVLCSLDNKGMWNLRSQIWERRYLGQQCYIRVWNDEKSSFTETDVPPNALYCGKAKHP